MTGRDAPAAPPVDELDTKVEVASGNAYHVTLPVFEGPLDLLLHLIQKHELDIFDIPVSFITQKYLDYLSLMQQLQIDVASEYLVMAATLAHIKSKSLLPPETTQAEEEAELEQEDPRAELIRRLLDYQKYKDAAERLNDRGALGRDVFLRGTPGPVAEGPAPLAPVGVFNLLDAFAKVLGRAKVKIEHEVSFDRLTISERIQQLCEQLAGRKWCQFEELFEGQRTRFDLIITFLALLEMTRLKMTKLHQDGPLAEIRIELCLSDSILDQASVDDAPIASAPVAPESQAPPSAAEANAEGTPVDEVATDEGTTGATEAESEPVSAGGEASELALEPVSAGGEASELASEPVSVGGGPSEQDPVEEPSAEGEPSELDEQAAGNAADPLTQAPTVDSEPKPE